MLQAKLKQYFGYETFRPGQEAIIEAVLAGRDTLGVLATGTGKSLCYQLPGYLLEGLVVVVSPLISLMEDQLDQLQQLGEKRGALLNGTQSFEEKQLILRNLARSKFLFLSPEMVQQEAVLATLRRQKIALLVIDEAHCISQWGYDFRPEYRDLPRLKEQLGAPVTLALTATATTAVQQDITKQLLKRRPFVYSSSVDRQNIALFVEETTDKDERLQELLEELTGAGIIYCATRKTVERVFQLLRGSYQVGYYHGGLPADQRKLLQQQFTQGKLQLLVATNAFGMGINKNNIRFILHYDLSDSLENYTQEIGRAGRDGQPSAAILLYQPGDERIHHYFQDQSRLERETLERFGETLPEDQLSDLQVKWRQRLSADSQSQFFAELKANEALRRQKLTAMLAYIQETTCRRENILRYFQEEMLSDQAECCDLHGAKLSEIVDNTDFSDSSPSSWQQILLRIFKDGKQP